MAWDVRVGVGTAGDMPDGTGVTFGGVGDGRDAAENDAAACWLEGGLYTLAVPAELSRHCTVTSPDRVAIAMPMHLRLEVPCESGFEIFSPPSAPWRMACW